MPGKAFIDSKPLDFTKNINRSVYVGNVDYGATAEELEQHFHGCGSINRVTILCNKYDGNPKGFAYVEFSDKDSTDTAMALDDSLFRGRQIKVLPKRTNKPGISSTNRPPRGSFRGRGRGYRGRGGFGAMRRPRYEPLKNVSTAASNRILFFQIPRPRLLLSLLRSLDPTKLIKNG